MNTKVKAIVCCGCVFGLPYNNSFFHVLRAVEVIEEKMLLACLAGNEFGVDAFRAAYLNFLSLCDWTEERYNTEFLAKVNQAW